MEEAPHDILAHPKITKSSIPPRLCVRTFQRDLLDVSLTIEYRNNGPEIQLISID